MPVRAHSDSESGRPVEAVPACFQTMVWQRRSISFSTWVSQHRISAGHSVAEKHLCCSPFTRELYAYVRRVDHGPVWEQRRWAYRRLVAATEIGDCRPSDVIGASARRPIIRAFTQPEIARDIFGMRQATMRNRWRLIVGIAADKPLAIGFIQVDGGLRGLGVDLGVDYTTLCRNLNGWENRQPPLVVTGHGKRTRARAPVAIIQIPLLTEWLLWTAEARAHSLGDHRGVIGFETITQIGRTLIPLGLPPPASPMVYWDEARRLLGH